MGKDNNPLMAQRVKMVHTYRDISGHNGAPTSTSATITTLTGAAITDDIGAIFCTNVGNVVMYAEPAGTAGTDSFPIPPGGYWEFCGTAAELQLAQIYCASTTTAGFMYREVYQ